MDDRQDVSEHNGTDQTCDENGPTCRRIQNDFAASLLDPGAPTLNQKRRSLIVSAGESSGVNAAKGS